MKLARSLVILLASLFVLGLVAGGLALTPAVQRWAVLRAVQGHARLQVRGDERRGWLDPHPVGRGAP
jgi:uncharacterized membrane protein